MGASFRNIGEITELAGCDLLTISPKLLEQLKSTEGELPRKLDPANAPADIQKIPMDKDTFDVMHKEDRMASEKLSEGIAGFTKALEALESLLAERLKRLDGQEHIQHGAEEIFHAYDLDGDGFITREEWAGMDAVFDALDIDHDGKITAAEMSAGLGAAYRLSAVAA